MESQEKSLVESKQHFRQKSLEKFLKHFLDEFRKNSLNNPRINFGRNSRKKLRRNLRRNAESNFKSISAKVFCKNFWKFSGEIPVEMPGEIPDRISWRTLGEIRGKPWQIFKRNPKKNFRKILQGNLGRNAESNLWWNLTNSFSRKSWKFLKSPEKIPVEISGGILRDSLEETRIELLEVFREKSRKNFESSPKKNRWKILWRNWRTNAEKIFGEIPGRVLIEILEVEEF